MPDYNQPAAVAPKCASELEAAFNHAQRCQSPAMPPITHIGPPVVLVPAGWEAQPLTEWTPVHSDRIRQTVELNELKDFICYLKAFNMGETAVFVQQESTGPCYRAILDYHSASDPGGCTHRVVFRPRRSVEWCRWLDVNGKAKTQTEFALFLEENLNEVMMPAGADLLQIINEFEVEGSLIFQRVQRQQSGSVKFSFQNEQRAKAGELEVPEMFTLRIALFDGSEPVEVNARLRYRLSAAGDLKLWFDLVNPHLLLRAALDNMNGAIEEGLSLSVLSGSVS